MGKSSKSIHQKKKYILSNASHEWAWRTLLKCRFYSSGPESVLRLCISHQFPGVVNAASLPTSQSSMGLKPIYRDLVGLS